MHEEAPTLTHERLRVYQVAREGYRELLPLLRHLPPRLDWLGDQARRAAGSVMLNIAEGAGEHMRRDKARFYRYALRSAWEVGAALDILVCEVPRAGAEADDLKRRYVEASRMLSVLIRQQGQTARGPTQ